MNFRKGKVREAPEINLISFIDVLLVIVIFLMVTTTYSRVNVLKPNADANKSEVAPSEITVGVTAQGQ